MAMTRRGYPYLPSKGSERSSWHLLQRGRSQDKQVPPGRSGKGRDEYPHQGMERGTRHDASARLGTMRLSERLRPYAVTERANSKTPAWLATGGPAHFGSVSDRMGATLPSELLWSARKASGE